MRRRGDELGDAPSGKARLQGVHRRPELGEAMDPELRRVGRGVGGSRPPLAGELLLRVPVPVNPCAGTRLWVVPGCCT